MSVIARWLAVALLIVGAVFYIPGVAGFALLLTAVLVMPIAALQDLLAGFPGKKALSVIIALLVIVAIVFAPSGGLLINAVEENMPAAMDTYVLNTNTMRFHTPECESVTEMQQHNRADFTGKRDELIQQGYKPCGACQPK